MFSRLGSRVRVLANARRIIIWPTEAVDVTDELTKHLVVAEFEGIFQRGYQTLLLAMVVSNKGVHVDLIVQVLLDWRTCAPSYPNVAGNRSSTQR